MESLADRLKNVHPNAQKRVRPDAKYVSAGLQEFYIERDEIGYWSIKMYLNYQLPVKLQGKWISFIEAERKLIDYLKSKDKWGKAIYPNGES
jgi:hypothetical protein